ncbi:MAG: universal stress protein [Deltaproteobacteria bacterium HGW-Deltaproteobacteria-18]|jgi:nucleotide-binding universal stress UspA family protein|nr:MAG: universal stress protein [Deltaproteobacteria bacterium HGW-Deltaproteobacteria-18]
MDPKKILIAVDTSDNAARAVTYVAELLGGSTGFLITVLYIERPPNRDLYEDDATWVEASQAQELRIRTFLQQAKSNLTGRGISPDAVTISYVPHCQSPVNPTAQQCSIGTSIARDILQVQQQGDFGTLVIGRRGVSRAEEFLFGSVTTKVTHLAKDCTVWVVQ